MGIILSEDLRAKLGVTFGAVAAVIFFNLTSYEEPVVAASKKDWECRSCVEYKGGEISVFVTPGEPTIVKFPGMIAKGIKKKRSTINVDKYEDKLTVFANEGISEAGEVMIVSLKDGNQYSVRLRRATESSPRHDFVRINDERALLIGPDEDDDDLANVEKRFPYVPPSKVSGLMRELVLMEEYGKKSIAGYKISERYKGETVLHDGAMRVTIDRILMGPNLWGYVLDAENLLAQNQRVNPSLFRIDGSRAISVKNWELAPKPAPYAEELDNKHRTKVYVITKAKN